MTRAMGAKTYAEARKRVEDGTPREAPGPDFRKVLKAWGRALLILDASELLLRDTIERRLEDVTVGRQKLTDVEAAIRQTMIEVKAIRQQAFRSAFRVLNGAVGDEQINGHSVKAWVAYLAAQDLRAIEMAIRKAIFSGQDNMEAARGVVGSAAWQGVDGTTEYVRHRLAWLAKRGMGRQ